MARAAVSFPSRMNDPRHSVALYGGTFDPVHLGHLAVARAAAERFELERVYFVPADVQPLKAQQKVTNFYHRYAMLALALEGEKRFVPSLLEAPGVVRASGAVASYTIDTIRRMRTRLTSETRLYFLMGMDAFLQVAKWRSPVELLRAAEFVIASRPGFPLKDVVQALPRELRPDEAGARRLLETGSLETNGATLHLQPDVDEDVSATAIREAARQGAGLGELVPRSVADYIMKLKIYGEEEEPGSPELGRV
jgi:nicotinate-nucleotide adenylyltransferase